MEEIPVVVELLYYDCVPMPPSEEWCAEHQLSPLCAHGLHAFYAGLKLGMRLSAACLDLQ